MSAHFHMLYIINWTACYLLIEKKRGFLLNHTWMNQVNISIYDFKWITYFMTKKKKKKKKKHLPVFSAVTKSCRNEIQCHIMFVYSG